jgi:hypothetical protein
MKSQKCFDKLQGSRVGQHDVYGTHGTEPFYEILFTNRFCLARQLPACSRILLEKLTVAQLVKKFAVIYGTRRFIAVFTRARHWIVS